MKRTIISRYFIKEILFSFFISFLFFFFVFFVNQILFIMGKLLKENVPFADVIKLVMYSLPIVVALSFPFGILVGALMSIGKMSFDNEILACLSSGISYFRIYMPIILIGIAVSLVSFLINDYLQPLGRAKTKQLRTELLHKNPELILKPFSTDIYEERVIINGDVSPEKGIEDIIIIDTNEQGLKRIIMSDRAKMADGEVQEGVLTLAMNNVFSISADKHNSDEFEYFDSSYMKYNILSADMEPKNTSLSPDEMRSIDIFKGIRRIKNDFKDSQRKKLEESQRVKFQLRDEYYTLLNEDVLSDNQAKINSHLEDFKRLSKVKKDSRELRKWRISFYQKIFIPLSCLSFILLAFPLGLTTKRSGRMMGFGIGLFITIVYWVLLMGTKIYAYRSSFNTLLIIASPNLFIIIVTSIIIPLRFKK